jgi:hypothetical protein
MAHNCGAWQSDAWASEQKWLRARVPSRSANNMQCNVRTLLRQMLLFHVIRGSLLAATDDSFFLKIPILFKEDRPFTWKSGQLSLSSSLLLTFVVILCNVMDLRP